MSVNVHNLNLKSIYSRKWDCIVQTSDSLYRKVQSPKEEDFFSLIWHPKEKLILLKVDYPFSFIKIINLFNGSKKTYFLIKKNHKQILMNTLS